MTHQWEAEVVVHNEEVHPQVVVRLPVQVPVTLECKCKNKGSLFRAYTGTARLSLCVFIKEETYEREKR